MNAPAPLILTLAMDERSFAFLDGQRRRYFPPERNHIPAHVTLFHALPGQEIKAVTADLDEVSADQAPVEVEAVGLRPLGRGVAYGLVSPALIALRARLADRWASWLTPQDRQSYRPHVTIQNKVDPGEARATLAELQGAFVPFRIVGEGLDLWHYRGGPWERARSFAFQRSLPAPG